MYRWQTRLSENLKKVSWLWERLFLWLELWVIAPLGGCLENQLSCLLYGLGALDPSIFCDNLHCQWYGSSSGSQVWLRIQQAGNFAAFVLGLWWGQPSSLLIPVAWVLSKRWPSALASELIRLGNCSDWLSSEEFSCQVCPGTLAVNLIPDYHCISLWFLHRSLLAPNAMIKGRKCWSDYCYLGNAWFGLCAAQLLTGNEWLSIHPKEKEHWRKALVVGTIACNLGWSLGLVAVPTEGSQQTTSAIGKL